MKSSPHMEVSGTAPSQGHQANPSNPSQCFLSSKSPFWSLHSPNRTVLRLADNNKGSEGTCLLQNLLIMDLQALFPHAFKPFCKIRLARSPFDLFAWPHSVEPVSGPLRRMFGLNRSLCAEWCAVVSAARDGKLTHRYRTVSAESRCVRAGVAGRHVAWPNTIWLRCRSMKVGKV
jgi:hypothetical protein